MARAAPYFCMKKAVSVLLVAVIVCSLFILPVSAEGLTLTCPNCGGLAYFGSWSSGGYSMAVCDTCGLRFGTYTQGGGGASRGGGAGRIEVGKKYYSQTSPDNESLYNAGSASYYTLHNTTNKTINYLNQSYTYNNYTYNNTYNYYNFEVENNYYYVTNNYTYVTISYPVGDSGSGYQNYESIDISYELPDGRNASFLTVDDVWGEYFVYSVVNQQRVMEDDGTTWGLFHMDGSLVDASYHPAYQYTPYCQRIAFTEGVWEQGFAVDKYPLEIVSSDEVSSFPANYSFEYFLRVIDEAGGRSVIQSFDSNPSIYNSLFGKGFSYNITPDDGWVHVVFQRYDGVFYVYFNGILQYKGPDYEINLDGNLRLSISTRRIYSVQYDSVGASAILIAVDELRYLIGDHYYFGEDATVGKFYFTPPAQPYDSNLVYVYPENPNTNDIAVQGSVDVSDYRIGGARPTIPTNGSVYIYLEDGICKKVQQYQVNQWVQINGSIWDGSNWVDLYEYSFVDIGNDETVDPPDQGGSSGEDGDFEGSVGGFLDTVLGIGSTIVNAVITLFTDIVGGITSAVPLFGKLASALSSIYTFLPEEWRVLLPAGFSIFLLVGVIKLFFS